VTSLSHATNRVRPLVRPLGRILRDTGFHRLRHATIYRDYDSPALVSHFSAVMQQDKPLFVGRIGGSDYDLVPAHFSSRKSLTSGKAYAHGVSQVSEQNGYFDLDDRPENFTKYLDTLVAGYMAADCLMYCGSRLIGCFDRNRFKRAEAELLRAISTDKDLINYTFIESLLPFLSSFRAWGEGRTILIVSPFSESVAIQYERRNDLIKDYEFPDFRLATYKSNMTCNARADTDVALHVATRNWHEECEKMARGIAELDFDIAFLSCASYSIYLGNFVKNTLGKKALYLGGILNAVFNIYGRRYDTAFFNSLVNLDAQIDPVENADVAHFAAGSIQSEALQAFFGNRSR
jgi:hypothetical protein